MKIVREITKDKKIHISNNYSVTKCGIYHQLEVDEVNDSYAFAFPEEGSIEQVTCEGCLKI